MSPSLHLISLLLSFATVSEQFPSFSICDSTLITLVFLLSSSHPLLREPFYPTNKKERLRQPPYLAAVLLGTVRTADRRGGDGTRQLGVGAQHGVRLSRACRTQFPDARR